MLVTVFGGISMRAETVKKMVDDLDNAGVVNPPKKATAVNSEEDTSFYQNEDAMNIGGLKPTEEDTEVINPHQMDYGLVVSHNDYYDNVTENNLLLGYYRPYFQYRYNGRHEANIRGKFSAKYYKYPSTTATQEEYYGTLEVLTYGLRTNSHNLDIGRKYYRLGGGLVLSNYADGLQYTFVSPYSSITVVAAYSGTYGKDLCKLSIEGCSSEKNSFDILEDRPEDANIGRLGQRILAGGQLDLPHTGDAQLSLIGLYTYDLIQEDSKSEQNYGYHPYYAGVSLDGFLGTPMFSYLFEVYYQGGKTYNIDYESSNPITGVTTSISGKDPVKISAYAIQSEINILLPFGANYFKPEAVFEFAMGSGDADKESTTDPINANATGKDAGFYAFGVYSGGLALKPSLGNLQIYRAGLDFRPAYFFYPLRNLAFSTRYSLYQKHISAGVISDTSATGSGRLVGHGFDFSMTFNARSDVQLYFGYGLFQPRTAYESAYRSMQHAYLANVTLVF